MVLVIPAEVTVMVPVLWAASVFALVTRKKLPMPLPVPLMTVSQFCASLHTVAVHAPADSTWIAVLLVPDVGDHVLSLTANVPAGACVTVISRVGAPCAVTVSVPRPDQGSGFRSTTISKLPLRFPLAGTALNQAVLLLVTYHTVFDSTVMRPSFPAAGTSQLLCDT